MTSRQTALLRELAQLVPPLLVLAVLLQLATGWGATHSELATTALMVVLTQLIPGLLVWRSVRPVQGWLVEDLVLGLALGAAITVPTRVLALLVGSRIIDFAVPLVIVLVLLGIPRSRRRIASRQISPLPWAWGLTVAATCALPIKTVLSAFAEPVRWQGWATPYVDNLFHVALTGELLHRFPPHYPQVAAEPLTYHWFTHAWTAHMSSVSGTETDVLLFRFSPILLAVVAPLLTAIVATRLSRLAWVGPLAAVVAYAAMDVVPWKYAGLSLPLHSVRSPTQQFSVLMILAVIAVLAVRWQHRPPTEVKGGVAGWATLPMLVLVMFVCGGSKGSTMAVIVAGCLLASAMALLLGLEQRRRVWLDTTLAVLVLGTLAVVIFRGASGGLALASPELYFEVKGGVIDPNLPPGVGWAVVVLLVLLTLTLGNAGTVAAALARSTRRDPMVWMLAGSGFSGLCAIVLLQHAGSSQYYFLHAAETPLAIVGAWGVGAVIAGVRRPALTATVGGVTGLVAIWLAYAVFGSGGTPGLTKAVLAMVSLLVAVGAVALAFAWLTRRDPGRPIATAVGVALMAGIAAGVPPALVATKNFEMPTEVAGAVRQSGSVHSNQVRAYRWLRDHSDPDDVVSTNLHCRGPVAASCDHRLFPISAYSERRVLIEGWGYTRGARKQYEALDRKVNYAFVPFGDPELLALNDNFFTNPTAKGANALRDLGVRWFVVMDRAPHADTLEPFARLRHEARGLSVYELSADLPGNAPAS